MYLQILNLIIWYFYIIFKRSVCTRIYFMWIIYHFTCYIIIILLPRLVSWHFFTVEIYDIWQHATTVAYLQTPPYWCLVRVYIMYNNILCVLNVFSGVTTARLVWQQSFGFFDCYVLWNFLPYSIVSPLNVWIGGKILIQHRIYLAFYPTKTFTRHIPDEERVVFDLVEY